MADLTDLCVGRTVTMNANAQASFMLYIALIAGRVVPVPEHMGRPCLNTVGMVDMRAACGGQFLHHLM